MHHLPGWAGVWSPLASAHENQKVTDRGKLKRCDSCTNHNTVRITVDTTDKSHEVLGSVSHQGGAHSSQSPTSEQRRKLFEAPGGGHFVPTALGLASGEGSTPCGVSCTNRVAPGTTQGRFPPRPGATTGEDVKEGSSGRPPKPGLAQGGSRGPQVSAKQAAHLQWAPQARMARDGTGQRLRYSRFSEEPRQQESCARKSRRRKPRPALS